MGVLFLCAFGWADGAERINQEGRILGAIPEVTEPILFNTPEADSVISAMQIFPVDNPWNERIAARPVLANSDAMIAQIIADLREDRRTLRAFEEMNFVLAPNSQPTIPIEFLNYPDESELNGGTFPFGLYPIPANMPVETWPSGTGGLSLQEWQTEDDGSDRHSIVVQPGNGDLWETWRAVRMGTSWKAANGAKFNLHTNALRPAGWTSGDAAGLPMFPALVRFDECERGMVEHACRIVVSRTRRSYIYPATHFASSIPATQTNVPAMGQRVRLKSSFVIPSDWTKQEKAVLLGLKKYGAIVADNGNFFSISVTPDDRWPSGCFDNLSDMEITNFEVIETTGAGEGPRSPDAPRVDAGADRTVSFGQAAPLMGGVTGGVSPVAIRWIDYSGPGMVTFEDATEAGTTASFSAPGSYTLMLSADDGIHAVAYDAVVLNVVETITLLGATLGDALDLTWMGGSGPFVVETSEVLPAGSWSGIVTTTVRNATVEVSEGTAFYRVRGN